MGSLTPTVRAEALGYAYQATGRGVHDVDLQVEAGEIIVLIGPNGSGKSTLARLVSTELAPGTGRLELFGHEVGSRESAVRRKIGLVGDTPVHVDELTGLQNAVFFARAYGLAPAEASQRSDELLDHFGLAAHANEPVATYSFGMRRRLLLAEALAHRPRLLVMDEPSVGLDATGQARLTDAVVAHAERGGAAIVATNHLAGVAEAADRIVFLLRGRVIADASPAQLMRDIRGVTLIDVAVGPGPVSWTGMEGLAMTGAPPLLRFESVSGTEPLPGLIRMLLEAGTEITSVSIREPGLADAFEALAGEALSSTGSTDSETDHETRTSSATRLRRSDPAQKGHRG